MLKVQVYNKKKNTFSYFVNFSKSTFPYLIVICKVVCCCFNYCQIELQWLDCGTSKSNYRKTSTIKSSLWTSL